MFVWNWFFILWRRGVVWNVGRINEYFWGFKGVICGFGFGEMVVGDDDGYLVVF